MKKCKYFVSFHSSRGFGRVDVFRNKKIKTAEDIDIIEKEIEKQECVGSVIIINFQKY